MSLWGPTEPPAPRRRSGLPAGVVLTALAGAGFFAACATTPAPDARSPRSAAEETAPGAPTRAAPAGRQARAAGAAAAPDRPPGQEPAPGDDTPAASIPGSAADAPAGPATPAAHRLAWVNPARCVSSCAFHPGPSLVRVNDDGAPDRRGHHQLDGAALTALRQLLGDARAAGHIVRITSAFRPYAEQVGVFRTMKEKGRAARPGHSEHQLGTTIDLRLPTTRAIDWVAEHAAAHGFVLSYPPGKQRITGYRPEPWHVRFVGRELAALVPAGGTLEELFRGHPELAESGDCADCPAPISRTKCGPLTAEGTCEGTVLTWCYDGARAAVDCAASRQTCGRAGGVPDCLPGDPVQPTTSPAP